MAGIAPFDQESVPEPKWLAQMYGIQWTGQSQILGGELAKVLYGKWTKGKMIISFFVPWCLATLELTNGALLRWICQSTASISGPLVLDWQIQNKSVSQN